MPPMARSVCQVHLARLLLRSSLFCAILNGAWGFYVERYLLKMDWNPSSCYKDASCDPSRVVNAFTNYYMSAKPDKANGNTFCLDGTPTINVTNQVSQGTKYALECIFENTVYASAGTNDQLWTDVWAREGSCSGLTVSDYFATLVKLYTKININQIAYEYGITNGTNVVKNTVDRDDFLDFVSAKVGRRAWIECDPTERTLTNIVICFDPNTLDYLDSLPTVIDCSWDRNDPTNPNGLVCSGTLLLPDYGNQISETCKPYMPYAISKSGIQANATEGFKADLPDESTPDATQETNVTSAPPEASGESSGTNIGLIAGSAIGGVIVVILLVLLIVWLVLRRKETQIVRGKDSVLENQVERGSGLPYVIGKPTDGSFENSKGHYSLDLDQPVTNTDGDGFKMWLIRIVGAANVTGQGRRNEFEFSQVEISTLIGRESYGMVYQGTYKGNPVAVKIFLDESMMRSASIREICTKSDGIMKHLDKESNVMSSLNHPNIIKFAGFCRIPPLIVTELCCGGTLAKKIAKAKNNPDMMPWNERLHIAIEIAKGIGYLHGRSMVHAGLRSTNILFDAAGSVKIADFNLSTILKSSMPSTTSSAASDPRWLAPELLGGGQSSSSGDIFSFGVILWELLELNIPWQHDSYGEICKKVQSGERPPIRYYDADDEQTYSLESYQRFSYLIQSCWHQNPAERPSIHTVLKSLSFPHSHTTEDFTAPAL